MIIKVLQVYVEPIPLDYRTWVPMEASAFFVAGSSTGLSYLYLKYAALVLGPKILSTAFSPFK